MKSFTDEYKGPIDNKPPSICLSLLFHYVLLIVIIMTFSGVITIYKSDTQVRGQGQRSRSQRSKPN